MNSFEQGVENANNITKVESKEKFESGIDLTITKTPEKSAEVVANVIFDEIINAARTDCRYVVGLSGGKSQTRISAALVENFKAQADEIKTLNFGKIVFLPTEVVWKEDPNAKESIVANQTKKELEIPLNEIGINANFYYASTEETWEEAQNKFSAETKNIDFQIVTLHESGAAKGIRDAQEIDGEPRYVQGLMRTRGLHSQKLDSMIDPQPIQLGGKVFQRASKDNPSRNAFEQYKKYTGNNEIVGYMSEGYKSYLNAKTCYVITEGAGKAEAVKRIFSNLKTRSQSPEERAQETIAKKNNSSGVASGHTVLNIRENISSDKKTHVIIDESAASLLDTSVLQEKGITVVNE